MKITIIYCYMLTYIYMKFIYYEYISIYIYSYLYTIISSTPTLITTVIDVIYRNISINIISALSMLYEYALYR